MDISFGVGTFNIQNLPDLSRADVRKSAGIVAAQADVVGFQEIAEVEDDQDLDAVLKPDAWIHEHRDSENAILAKKSRFKIIGATRADDLAISPVQQKHLSNGLAHVTPERNLCWVIFAFVEDPSLTPVALVNTHLVSGVYLGNDHYKERLALRNEEYNGIKQWVQHLVDHNVNVIFTADTNWTDMPKFHPNQRWFINDGIDKIAYVQTPVSNYDLTMVSAERYNNPSDHDFRVANVVVKSHTPPTKQQQIDAWLKKNAVSKTEYGALVKIQALKD